MLTSPKKTGSCITARTKAYHRSIFYSKRPVIPIIKKKYKLTQNSGLMLKKISHRGT